MFNLNLPMKKKSAKSNIWDILQDNHLKFFKESVSRNKAKQKYKSPDTKRHNN